MDIAEQLLAAGVRVENAKTLSHPDDDKASERLFKRLLRLVCRKYYGDLYGTW